MRPGIKLGNGQRRAYADQAAFRDEARQAARGVSAAAEAKNKEFIPQIVIIDQPFISPNDLIIQTATEHAAHPAASEGRSHPFVVIRDLLQTVRCDWREQGFKPPLVFVSERGAPFAKRVVQGLGEVLKADVETSPRDYVGIPGKSSPNYLAAAIYSARGLPDRGTVRPGVRIW